MPLLSSTQLHSNFELNSKLPNFTRDSFKTLNEMNLVDPQYMDEGHISYCEETDKHYVYNTVNNRAIWTELIGGEVTVVAKPENANKALADTLNPGSLVFVKSTDRLYYKGFTKAIENHDPEGKVSAWLHPIIPITELEKTYLKKVDADNKYLTKTGAENTYLSKDEATRDYLTKDDADDKYLNSDDAGDIYLGKTDAANTYLKITTAESDYIKKAEIEDFIDNYVPSQEYRTAEVWTDVAKGLQGKTGQEIVKEELAYSQILDEIIFNEVLQHYTTPSLKIKLNLKQWLPDGVWYDEKAHIVTVTERNGPDIGKFAAEDIVNSLIVETNKAYTNGIISNSLNQNNSKVICQVQDENGEWVDYASDETTSHIPVKLTAGVYRYYFIGHFWKSVNPIKNNRGEVKEYWDESTPIQSSNYITINVSKPVKYNTTQGMVESGPTYWDKVVVDYFTLPATCQASQKFILPRKAKHIYIWNDICGYAEDLSFVETVSGSDYIYEYKHQTEGHRGSIKIKVEF